MRERTITDTSTTQLYRPLRITLIAALLAIAAFAAVAIPGEGPVFREHGPAEIAQLMLWISAAFFALVLALLQQRTADKAALAIVGLAALAAAAREIDAHILLNPETIGSLGVRYRIDWWLNADVAIARKLAWATIALAAAAVLATATIAAHFHPVLAAKRRSRAVIYFALAAACMALGFTFDDLLRGRIDLAAAQAAEESVEVLAPLFYLAAANHLAVSALVGRRAAVHQQATADTLTPCPPKPKSSPSQRSTSTASPSESPDSTTTTRPASATASAHS